MSVCALDHVVLNVANVEQSLHFYQTALGLGAERVEAWRRGEVGFPSLRINESTIIDLVSDSASPAQSRSGARGNALSIYFHDPDQNLIELRIYAGQA